MFWMNLSSILVNDIEKSRNEKAQNNTAQQTYTASEGAPLKYNQG